MRWLTRRFLYQSFGSWLGILRKPVTETFQHKLIVLKLLEKTIVLVVSATTKLTYEHRDDELLGVTKSSSTHVATIVKDKSFLLQHDKSFLKRDSTQVFSCEYCKNFKNTYFEEHLGTAASWKRVYKHLLKTIKSKKQSFTATTDSTNLAQVAVVSFEVAPCTKQEWADGGRKDPIEVTMVNTFCSRERESLFNKTSL